MKAIVAVDENNGIGFHGDLLFNIKEDMKRFRELTKDGTVIMGSNTWKSLPKKPLPNRKNIIITRDKDALLQTISLDDIVNDNVIVCNLEEFYEIFKCRIMEDPNSTDSWWLIGGAYMYQELVWLCDTIEMTKIYATAPECDTYLTDFDLPYKDYFVVNDVSDIKTENDIQFRFITIHYLEKSNIYTDYRIIDKLRIKIANEQNNIILQQIADDIRDEITDRVYSFCSPDGNAEKTYMLEYMDKIVNRIQQYTGIPLDYTVDKLNMDCQRGICDTSFTIIPKRQLTDSEFDLLVKISNRFKINI